MQQSTALFLFGSHIGRSKQRALCAQPEYRKAGFDTPAGRARVSQLAAAMNSQVVLALLQANPSCSFCQLPGHYPDQCQFKKWCDEVFKRDKLMKSLWGALKGQHKSYSPSPSFVEWFRRELNAEDDGEQSIVRLEAPSQGLP